MLFRIRLNKILTIATLALLVACKKDESTDRGLEDGKSVLVKDLAGDTKASIASGIDGKEKRPFYTFLYSLEQKRQIWIRTASDSATHLKTNTWDIAFAGNYNGEVQINNRKYEGTPGFGGPVERSAIVMIAEAYEKVTQAPADSEFDKSQISSVGMVGGVQSTGWYSYDMTSHIFKPYSNRTYVLRLPSGKYAKLQLVNVYKGNPPAVTDMFWPAPYLTFKYFVQADGSKNLNTN